MPAISGPIADAPSTKRCWRYSWKAGLRAATCACGPAGEIVSVTAERHLAAESSFVLTPWNGRFWQHEVRAGMRIPVRGEVSWLLDGEWRPYWRGRVVRVDYDFAPEPEGRL